MNESTVLIEEPMRFPNTIEENVFFYSPANEVFVRRGRGVAQVPNPLIPNGVATQQVRILSLTFFTLTLVLAAISAIFFQSAIPLPLFIAGFFYGRKALITYIGKRHAQTVTQRFFKEGSMLQGKIISCVATIGGTEEGGFFVEIMYEYIDPHGFRQLARTTVERPEMYGNPLPLSGTPIYILYFSNDETYLL